MRAAATTIIRTILTAYAGVDLVVFLYDPQGHTVLQHRAHEVDSALEESRAEDSCIDDISAAVTGGIQWYCTWAVNFHA